MFGRQEGYPPTAPVTLNYQSIQARQLVSAWAALGKPGVLCWDNGPGRRFSGTLAASTSWAAYPQVQSLLMFSGAGTGIDIGDHSAFQLTGSFTVTGWIYPQNLTGDAHIILSCSNAITAGGWEFAVQNDVGTRKLGFAFYTGAIRGWYESNTTLAVNTLYHVALTYKPGTAVFYVNGHQDGERVISSASIVYNSDHLRLGYQSNNLEWQGGLTDIRFYAGWKTDAEIGQLYNPATRWDLYAPIQRYWAAVIPAGSVTGSPWYQQLQQRINS